MTILHKLRLISHLLVSETTADDLSFFVDLSRKMHSAGVTTTDILSAVDLIRELNTHASSDSRDFDTDSTLSESDSNHIARLLDCLSSIVQTNLDVESGSVDTKAIIDNFTSINRISRLFTQDSLAEFRRFNQQYRNELSNDDCIATRCFSQEGEDLILRRILPLEQKGFFVDIGAHHPTRFSNTYFLYIMGWSGINIDAQPGVMELFDRVRPRDINIEAAVGSHEHNNKPANYISFKEPAYNSVYIDDISTVKNTVYSEIVSIHEIQLRSLDDILESLSDSFAEIDLLSIDVEGFEMQVLSGFTIEKYRPKLVIIEVRGFDIDSRDSFPVYRLLVDHGYKLRSVLFHSLIFEKI